MISVVRHIFIQTLYPMAVNIDFWKRKISTQNYNFFLRTLKTKSFHDADFVVTGGIGSCDVKVGIMKTFW